MLLESCPDRIEAELKDLGVFYHGAPLMVMLRKIKTCVLRQGLLVRIVGGEFAEVVVNLKD